MGVRADVWQVEDDAVLYKSIDSASIAASLWTALTYEIAIPMGDAALK